MKRSIGSRHTRRTVPWLALAIAAAPGMAQAYVGPGAGLTAIGTMLALLAALVLAVVGFVWYPIKRMMRKKDQRTGTPSDPSMIKHGHE